MNHGFYLSKNENMNENVDLFILTHADFKVKPSNPIYQIVSQGPKIENTTLPVHYMKDEGQPYMKLLHSMSEMANMAWICENMELKKYVGICHYRCYYDFRMGGENKIDAIPNLEKMLEKHDVIALDSWGRADVRKVFVIRCAVHDWDILQEVMDDMGEGDEFRKYGATHRFMYKNMMVMPSENFKEMVAFQQEVMMRFCDKVGRYTDSEFLAYVTENTDAYKDKIIDYFRDMNYQSRLLSFVGEVASAYYAYKTFKNPIFFDYVYTQNDKIKGEVCC